MADASQWLRALTDGESFFVFAIEPGPSESYLTLYPHPERHDELINGPDGRQLPPRAIIARTVRSSSWSC